MSNSKNTTEKVVTPPYTTKHLIEDIQKCISPLFAKPTIIRKWSSDIAGFINCYNLKSTYVEQYLYTKRDKKFYINKFKKLKDTAIELAGKLIVPVDMGKNELDKLMLEIKIALYDICAYACGYKESWLYIWEYGNTLEDAFEKLYDNLFEARENLYDIDKKYQNIEMEEINLFGTDYWLITQISEIYPKLINLFSNISLIESNDRLYQHEKLLQDFARKILNELIYFAGSLYMQLDRDIKPKYKNRINQYFHNLESEIHWVFSNISSDYDYGTFADNEIFYSYQELKSAIKKMLYSIKI